MRSRILFVSGHRDDARQISQMLHALPVAVDHAERCNTRAPSSGRKITMSF